MNSFVLNCTIASLNSRVDLRSPSYLNSLLYLQLTRQILRWLGWRDEGTVKCATLYFCVFCWGVPSWTILIRTGCLTCIASLLRYEPQYLQRSQILGRLSTGRCNTRNFYQGLLLCTSLMAIQVIANQTVVQAQATARANVAKANGESQAIQVITSQLKQSPQYLQCWLSTGGMVKCHMLLVVAAAAVVVVAVLVDFRFSNYQNCRHSSSHSHQHSSKQHNKT